MTTPVCTASIHLYGEHFPCDWPTDETGHHEGWGHANKRAQAVWTGDDTETSTASVRNHDCGPRDVLDMS